MVDTASLSLGDGDSDDFDEVYVELHLHTCYSLLEGASQPWELTELAEEYRYRTLAITDRNNLYGAMVFAQRCRDAGIRPIIGVELTVADDVAQQHDLTLLAENRQGYANLCRLVSMANGWGLTEQADRERRRTDPCVTLEQLRQHTDGVICLTGGRNGELAQRLDAGDRAGAGATLQRWIDWFGRDNVWVELHDNLVLGDRPRIRAQVALARQLDVGIVATGDVHYHEEDRYRLHDALCAIRHRTTLDGCHVQRRPNSEFYLRGPVEQQQRFAEWPDAIHNSVRIADRCTFNLLDNLGYDLPTPPVEAGHTPDSWLHELCARELEDRYRGNDKLALARRRLDEELRLIARHRLAGFFLVYHEVLGLAHEVAEQVRGDAPRARLNMAPGRGRGSSVSSIVCYLIGLSHIDPIENDLFLGRFLNESMTTLPDIDLDFPRDIRDQLFQKVYEHWGTDHAALVATFPRYRIRSAVRDLGKVLGLPSAEIDRLAKLAEGYSPANNVQAEMEQIPELRHLVDNQSWTHLIDLARQLANFPRHVSQHVGGVVISSDPLIDCVPIQPTAWPGRYVCQWDKDDIDDARMVKIDFLALGMLSLVEECLDLCYEHRDGDEDGEGDLVDLSRIDFKDTKVFDRICRGDTMGVFQIESRAQAGILPRTRPEQLDDLTAQVAIIRPGPIVGGAVTRFIEGRADPQHNKAFHHDCLNGVLDRTFGVVLFQEQVVQVAMNMGGFDSGEAEQFRRAMSRKDWTPETTDKWRDKFRAGAGLHKVSEDDAGQVFKALIGFAQFGFPESHAAAFGLLAYQTAWLREYYPAEFYCALFNNWPMGFYPPHVFTNDARRHGIEILRPSINTSDAKCTVVDSAASPPCRRSANRVEPFHGTGTIRVGLNFINGMGAATIEAVLEERRRGGPFQSLRDFARRTQLGGEAIESAIRAGAFDELCHRRRELLWEQWLLVKEGRSTAELKQPTRPRQLQLDLSTEQDHVTLPTATTYQAMVDDYEVLGLSPTAHPMQFLRGKLADPPLLDSRQLLDVPTGRRVDTAGLVVVRQRPGTAKGVVYLLLEDEHGVVNVVVSPRLYDEYRSEIRGSPFLRIRGIVDPPAGDTAAIRARTIAAIHPGPLRAPNGKSWG